MKEIAVNFAFSTLFALLKNGAEHTNYKRAFLKGFKLIRDAFRGDEEFEAICKE